MPIDCVVDRGDCRSLPVRNDLRRVDFRGKREGVGLRPDVGLHAGTQAVLVRNPGLLVGDEVVVVDVNLPVAHARRALPDVHELVVVQSYPQLAGVSTAG